MQVSNISILFVAISLALLSPAVGCSEKNDSPSGIVIKLYNACNEGRYSEVKKMMPANIIEAVEKNGGIKYMCDINTRRGTVARVEITNEQIRGEGANVTATIHFTDGTRKTRDVTSLVKDGGSWKLSP